MVTGDKVGDPQALELWLKVNGETMRKSNTADKPWGRAGSLRTRVRAPDGTGAVMLTRNRKFEDVTVAS